MGFRTSTAPPAAYPSHQYLLFRSKARAGAPTPLGPEAPHAVLRSGTGSWSYGSAAEFTLWWTNKKLWKITIFHGKIHYKWPFSIAFCMFTRGYPVDQDLLVQTLPPTWKSKPNQGMKLVWIILTAKMEVSKKQQTKQIVPFFSYDVILCHVCGHKLLMYGFEWRYPKNVDGSSLFSLSKLLNCQLGLCPIVVAPWSRRPCTINELGSPRNKPGTRGSVRPSYHVPMCSWPCHPLTSIYGLDWWWDGDMYP